MKRVISESPAAIVLSSRAKTLRLRRSPCNLAVLAAFGLLGAGTGALAVPPGTKLPANTIPVLRGLVSDYRNSATFSTVSIPNGSGRVLTVNQLLPKIILDWKEFNVGNGSRVEFVQPSTTAAVLNRIYDADPSIIQGQIKANGQVLLLNQNGILFDRGTQIDVNTLVASSMNIDDNVFKKGMTSGNLSDPAFTGGFDPAGRTLAGAKTGAIVIGANGSATSDVPRLNATSGGSIVLIAPIIDNQSGVITSPDGQVILAAGRSAYLGFGSSSSSSLRGMLVEVSAGAESVDISSLIRNSGNISADRGNVTLAGLAINQSGRVSASSATLTNGSIYLQARTIGSAQRGSVNLSATSVIDTPLDTTDKTTLREGDDYRPFRSVVQIEGAQIVNEGRITSPSGNVLLDARSPIDPTKARIYLAGGSSIDASGAWSDASDASNFLTFKVTSNELKDSPDQKSGILRGATVTVDLRAGSSVLDLSGYQQNQARSLAQKASVGGTISLSSGGDLIQRTGSTMDVSGGGVRYSGATVATTKLIGADGRVYDIGSAPEALKYTTIADKFLLKQQRWGYDQTFLSLLSGAGATSVDYTQGSRGGEIQVSLLRGARGLVLDGALLGGTTLGSQQRGAAPRGAALTVGLIDPTKKLQDFGVDDVTFRSGALASLPADFAATSPLGVEQKSSLNLSTSLFADGAAASGDTFVTRGFGTVSINANGRITLPKGIALQGPAVGSIRLQANQIEIDGNISAPAGTIALSTVLTVGSASSPTSASSVVVGRSASIEARGTWSNGYLSGLASSEPTAVLSETGGAASTRNGGSVSITGPIVDVQAGSVIDVSSGGSASTRGAISTGSGGSISLAADSALDLIPLKLAGELSGFGFGIGGSLSLSTAGAMRIGAGTTAGPNLNVAPSFFTEGGFQKYSLSAARDLTISADALIRPEQASLQLDNTVALSLPSGANLARSSRHVWLQDDLRKPTSVAMSTAAGLVMRGGARIDTDPGASISLAAGSGMLIDGVINAPSGIISLALNAPDQLATVPTLDLGLGGALLARGTFVPKPNDQGLRQGSLTGGGTVTLSASRASIVLDAGSSIDVSGERQLVDLPTMVGSSSPFESRVQYSNSGALSITGNDAITLAGSLRGMSEGTGAGGSFALSLSARGDLGDPTTARRIVLTQTGTPVAGSASFKDAAVSVGRLMAGGFDKLRLKSENEILFVTAATLAFNRGVTLDAKVLQVANDNAVTVLGTAVKLANSTGERVRSNPNDPNDQSSKVDPALPSVSQATVNGHGRFSVFADTLDVIGSVTISGTSLENLYAQNDLRLSGRTVGIGSSKQGAQLVGSIRSAGDLTLSAAQIYPTTGTNFTVSVSDGLTGVPVTDGRIRVAPTSSARGDVYSAGGSLTLAADDIVQGGVVKAPLGNLNLRAGKTLELGAASITSVSADGLTIPYGETQAGVTWTYAPTGSDPLLRALEIPPNKRLALTAPSVNVRAGALVDVSGGGDIAAVEFVPGSGGSKNALIQPNTYAILPKSMLGSAPIDPDIALSQNLGFGGDSAVYNSVRIGSGGVVPAGDYTLLPGYYGLLPGGYLVQLLNGSAYSNLRPGQTATLQNGWTVVPGVMLAAGTDVMSSQTIGVVVRPGSDIQTLADYTVSKSDYFAHLADKTRSVQPRLPQDGGLLAVSATQSLALDGTLRAGLPTPLARSAEVDIAAAKVALVDHVGRTDIATDFLQIDAASLSKLDASLLIGGLRTEDASGVRIAASASDILVVNGVETALKASELILVSTDNIAVKAGSRIDGEGARAANSQDLTIVGGNSGSGALLRIANSGLVDVKREVPASASRGTLSIESGATLSAAGSLILDATNTTTSKGDIAVADGGGLSLVSGTVSLGDLAGVAGLDNGLTLDNVQLAGFNRLGKFSLKSYGSMDLYGAARIGTGELKTLVLDSATINGYASGTGVASDSRVAAAEVDLINSSGSRGVAASAGPAAGVFDVSAKQIVVGAGDKRVDGYAEMTLNASGEILVSGTGTLQTASSLNLQAARIASTSGANQTWTAVAETAAGSLNYRPVAVSRNVAANPLPVSTALGSRLHIIGSSIADSGEIVMRSGGVSLEALSSGNDGIALSDAAVIDAGGASKDFRGTIATGNAGKVKLEALTGQVRIGSGSRINLAAADAGGDAGELDIFANTVALDGSMAGTASKGAAGRFVMDVASIGDFSALNSMLNAGGFNESRDIRVHSGGLAIAATDVVNAHHLVLSADQGPIDVLGRVDASAALGKGTVELYGNTVRLASGASIDASGTSALTDTLDSSGKVLMAAAYADGGSVALVAQGGQLEFESGAQIDVRAGAKGSAGEVLLRAPRTVDSVQAHLVGRVLSQRHSSDAAAKVSVEGNRVYGETLTGSVVTSDMMNGYAADNSGYMGAVNAHGIAAGIVGDGDGGAEQGNVHVRPSVELRAAGDLRIADNWDLTGAGWVNRPSNSSVAEAGSLIVRAAGDLTLSSASLGNPNAALQSGPTWNIALASGADLHAANPAQTQNSAVLRAQLSSGTAGAGDLVLDSQTAEASIRTGTGNVRLAAGRDFVIKSGTDGQTGMPVVGVVYTSGKAAIPDPLTSPPDARFAEGGGNIAITAHRDAIGAGNEWMTEWFRYSTQGDGGLANGVWWSYRPNFHDGVATLGGGNVSIVAGNNIDNLSAFAPTSAIKNGTGTTATLQVFGGGNVELSAGSDILGGQYLLSRGEGSLTAGGSLGVSGRKSQLFMMGASGDEALAKSHFRMNVGESINLATIDSPSSLFQSEPFGDAPSFNPSNRLGVLGYSSNSAVELTALGGSITVGNRPVQYATLSPDDQSLLNDFVRNPGLPAVMPAKVSLVALSGDVIDVALAAGSILAPSPSGSLKVLAGKGIAGLNFTVSDADPGLFAIQNVSDYETQVIPDLLTTSVGTPNRLIENAVPDRFVNDVVALGGSIKGAFLKAPSRSRVWSSQDILNPVLRLQNLGTSDISEVIADAGSVFGSLTDISINGPGALTLQGGQNVSLGTSRPLVSNGNLGNLSLPSAYVDPANPGQRLPGGATITVLAGVAGQVDIGKLDQTFDALTNAGSTHDAAAANAAIDLLFTGTKIAAGNIDSYNTSIQSFSGAPINLLAPAGSITVGLTTPNKDRLIGVVTNSGGAIRSYLSGNFDINQGKVLTAQGGDILIYTAEGSIDAGRGAKTSVTTPPPKRTPILDSDNNLVGYSYTLPVAVEGSGVQTATSKPSGPTSVAPPSGNIYLFAPGGTIDAGEAGISSGGNIVIAAVTVLNADNISSAGSSTGVPPVAVGSVASSVAASGAATAAGTTKEADAASRAAAAAAAASAGSFKPAILTVEVLGFGDKNCKEQDKNCFAK